ncbi:MAG TPA: hypothetical protein VNT01_17965, partial [Symbiobacteriaceae bacterium]|nr:hypothetical protein [Symbiobacteriaceae bacterium]
RPEGRGFNRPEGRPEGRPFNRPEGRPEGRPFNRPEGRPEGRPFNRPEGRPEGRPFNRPEGRPEGRPFNRPEGRPEGRGFNRPEGRPEGRGFNRPEGRSFDRPQRMQGGKAFARGAARPAVEAPAPPRDPMAEVKAKWQPTVRWCQKELREAHYMEAKIRNAVQQFDTLVKAVMAAPDMEQFQAAQRTAAGYIGENAFLRWAPIPPVK